jgi:hypothetical protein
MRKSAPHLSRMELQIWQTAGASAQQCSVKSFKKVLTYIRKNIMG